MTREEVDSLSGYALDEALNHAMHEVAENGKTRTAIAHQVIESMLARFGLTVDVGNGLDSTWEATFYDPRKTAHPWESDNYAPGNSFAEAVFRSAIKALL